MGRLIPDEVFPRLLECGRWASSADNCQPWRFTVVGDQLHVRLQPTGAFYDVDSLPSYFAIGGAIENIRIAASHLGYVTNVSRFPAGEGSGPAAVVSLEATDRARSDPLYAVVFERCTNRKPYSRRPVEARGLEELQAVPDPASGCRLVLRADPDVLATAASLVMRADQIRFEHAQTHREFHEKLRFTNKEKMRCADGISVDTLELGPLGGSFLRFLRPWKRMARLNRMGLSRLMALHARFLTLRAGAVGVVVGQSRTPVGFMQGGEAFHRMWLTATRLGFALQPMAALPLYLLRLDRLRGAGFEQRHVRLLTSLKRTCMETFGIPPHEFALILFRLGYARPPTARSVRRAASEVTG